MNELKNSSSQDSEHIRLAHEFSSKILEFNPELQNEIVLSIFNRIKDNRRTEIEETDKKLAYLLNCENSLLLINNENNKK